MKKQKNKIKLFTQGRRLFYVLMLTFISQQLYSQAIFQPTRILGERNHLVVSGIVLKCDTLNQIHLKVLNNGTVDIDADFDLIITNTKTGKFISKDVKITKIKPNQVFEGTCKGGYTDLVFKLPSGYDIGNIAMMVNFDILK